MIAASAFLTSSAQVRTGRRQCQPALHSSRLPLLRYPAQSAGAAGPNLFMATVTCGLFQPAPRRSRVDARPTPPPAAARYNNMHKIAPALQRLLICATFLLKQFENGRSMRFWIAASSCILHHESCIRPNAPHCFVSHQPSSCV